MKPDIHQVERFLDVLDMLRSQGDMIVTQTDIATQGANSIIWNKAGAQESVGMQLLDPLAVGDIAFASGDIFDMLAVDQADIDTGSFEHLEESDPIDTGGFHSNRGNLVFFEIGDGFEELIGKGPEGTDLLIFDTDKDRLRAYINTGTIGIDSI